MPARAAVARLRDLVFGTRALALLDQAAVSGTNFFTSVMIARFAGAGELGLYAIAISVLVTLLAVQESLVLLPYTIQKHQPAGTPREHAATSLALSGMLSTVGVVVLMAAAMALYASGEPSHPVAVALALSALVPFAMAREFARQFGFAHLKVAQVLALDAAVAVVQLGTLGVLGVAGQLSALTACLALCATYGLLVIAWLVVSRAHFAVRIGSFRADLARSWSLGKWLLVGRVAVQVQCYITYWISVVFGGASMTGVFAACMSIIAFSNPIVFGFGNVLTPRSVTAWKTGGGRALLGQAARDAGLLAGLMGAFCLVIIVAGSDLMALLYRGTDFAHHGGILVVLALANASLAIGMPATSALAAMERPRAVLTVQATGATVTVVLVSILIVKWGLYGAAYGALAGSTVGTLARWITLIALTRKRDDLSRLANVLRWRFPQRDFQDWEIKRLGEGDYATAYLTAPGIPALVPDPAPIVVKLYKSDAGKVQADADALLRLGGAIDGRRSENWTVDVPKLMFVCQSPPALGMTLAPGRDVFSATAAETLSLEILGEAGKAVSEAMHGAWKINVAHDDFGLRNILIDFQAKHIALIDPGTAESCAACGALVGKHSAAARDLAHMACELATDVSDLIGRENARARRDAFVMGLLSAADHSQQNLTAEVKACIATHLSHTLQPSWSARGCWHRLIMRLARDRLAVMFAALERQGRGNSPRKSTVNECDHVGDQRVA